MSKRWGTPTWFFMHTFAEHITDDFYKSNAKEICNIFMYMFQNLPCTECTKHAVQYSKLKLTPKMIQSKEDLKQFFYTFHNHVNKRLGKPIFKHLDNYKKYNLYSIFNKFSHYFCRDPVFLAGFIRTKNRHYFCTQMKNILQRFKNHMDQQST